MKSTSTNTPVGFPLEDADPNLAQIVQRLTESAQAGENVDIGELAEAYPKYAKVLGELLPTIEALMCFGRPTPTGASSVTGMAESDSSTSGILGDYRIVREVGRGGMGIVYEAEQISLRRRVALKVLPFAAVLDQRQLQRFKNEAIAVGTLEHPNIVPVYSVGCERGVHYYAMRLIDGQSLAEVITQLQQTSSASRDAEGQDQSASQTRQTDTRPTAALTTKGSTESPAYSNMVARLGIQAARALQHAHQAGLVHRDIKPSNLLINSEGHLWVTDFGLARMPGDSSLTMTGDLLGTLRYMSPEQSAGGSGIVDHRTDIYSLGVTLYELLTLRLAFGGDDRQQLLREIDEVEPLAPRKVNSAIPKDFETIVLKAITKEPHGRYGTASELADDIKRFLENKPIRARRTGRLDHLWRWARRKPTIATLTAIVATLLLFLGIAGPLVGLKQTALIREAEQRNSIQAALVRETRRSLYVSDVNSAYQAWEEANLDRVCGLLRRHVPRPGQEELRGFEWHYLWAQYQSVLMTPKFEHGSPILSVAFSPDATRLATAGRDRNVRIWAVDQREEIATISGPWERVNCVAFSPDGTMLAIGCVGDSVTLWDIATANELRKLKLAVGDVLSLAFSPSGRLVAANEGPVVKIWEVDSGKHLHRLIGHDEDVNSLAFSPDEKTLASAGGEDRTVNVWNVESGHMIKSLHHNHVLCSVAFSPDGKTLASGSFNYEIGLWDVKTWDKRSTIRLPGHSITCVTFSPDGHLLASAGRENSVRLWDPKTTKLLATIRGHSSDVTCVAFSPDGEMFATGSLDSRAMLWDVGAYRPEDVREVIGEWRTPVVFSRDGRYVAVASGLWQAETKREPEETRIWHLPSGQKRVLRDQNCAVLSAAFSLGGDILITGGERIDTGEGRITLWDTDTGAELGRLEGHKKRVWWLACSPVRDLLASGDATGVVKVWDLRKRITRFSISTGFDVVMALTFSRDGENLLAAVGQRDSGLWEKNCKVKLWHADTGDPVATLTAHRKIVMSADFSPDGALLATGSWDGTIKLWNVATWTEKLTIRAHSMPVFSVAFCPDGRTLASGSSDATVKLWQVPSGEEFCTLKRSAAVDWVAFSPDGKTLAFTHIDKSVTLWHAAIERGNWPVSLR